LGVNVGQRVTAGQVIGYFVNNDGDVPSSGNAMRTSPSARHQLHFELIEATGVLAGQATLERALGRNARRVDPTTVLLSLGFLVKAVD
jgi:murein DD-endopeptidase MepM/ murein hydrolase activator NlpD